MQINDIYHRVLLAARQAAGIHARHFRHSRTERAATARAVFVDTLLRLGFTEAEIVRLTGASQQRVNYIKNTARRKLHTLSARLLQRELWERVKHLAPGE